MKKTFLLFYLFPLFLGACSDEPAIDLKTINWKTATKTEVKKGINEQNVNSMIKIEDTDGSYKEFTPLEKALSEDASQEVIEALLKKKADVNLKTKFKNKDGSIEEKNAMAVALEKNASPELVKILFKFGASPREIFKKEMADGTEQNIPVIAYAAKYNTHEDVMKEFIRHFKINDDDVLTQTRRQINPVWEAAAYNENEKVLEVLYNYPDYVNKDNFKIKGAPASAGNIYIVQMMDKQKEVQDLCRNMFLCTIHYAARYSSNPKMVDMILNYSARHLKEKQRGNSLKDLIPVNEETGMDEFSVSDLAIQFNKNSDVVKAIINAAQPEDKATRDALTPLMRAAKYSKDPEIINLLVKMGHDVNKYKNERIVVEKEVDLGNGHYITREDHIDTKIYPIMLALDNDEPKIFEALLANGAVLDEKMKVGRKQKNILEWAVERGFSDKIMEQLFAKFDPNMVFDSGNTPMLIAVRYTKNPELVEMLIKKGANLSQTDKEKRSLLTLAAEFNPTAGVLTALNKAGLNIDGKDKKGDTALMVASRSVGKEAVIKEIASLGANINQKGKDDLTPLMAAAKFSNDPKVVQALIDAGANVNEKKMNGDTPLLLAASFSENPDVIATLIKAGAKTDAVNNANENAIQLAARSNKKGDSIRVLKENGFDLTKADKNGDTPFFTALRHNSNMDVISGFIKTGEDVNQKNKNGLTPLMFAAKNARSLSLIDTLLNAGADPNMKTEDNKNALFFALATKKNALIQKMYEVTEKNVEGCDKYLFQSYTQQRSLVDFFVTHMQKNPSVKYYCSENENGYPLMVHSIKDEKQKKAIALTLTQSSFASAKTGDLKRAELNGFERNGKFYKCDSLWNCKGKLEQVDPAFAKKKKKMKDDMINQKVTELAKATSLEEAEEIVGRISFKANLLALQRSRQQGGNFDQELDKAFDEEFMHQFGIHLNLEYDFLD